MSKTSFDGAARSNLFMVPPTQFTMTGVHGDRLNAPVSEGIVLSMMAIGWMTHKPIKARRNGDMWEIVDGCQRIKAAIEANKRRAANGLPPLLAPTVVYKGTESRAYEEMVASNEMDLKDGPVDRAKKIATLMQEYSKTKDDIAVLYGWKTTKTVDNHLALLDCAPEVQQAVQSGKVTMTDAITKIVNLPRDKQVEALQEMATSGATAAEAVESRGGKVTGKAKGVSKGLLKKLLVEKAGAFNVREKLLINWILGKASNGDVAEKFPELARVRK